MWATEDCGKRLSVNLCRVSAASCLFVAVACVNVHVQVHAVHISVFLCFWSISNIRHNTSSAPQHCAFFPFVSSPRDLRHRPGPHTHSHCCSVQSAAEVVVKWRLRFVSLPPLLSEILIWSWKRKKKLETDGAAPAHHRLAAALFNLNVPVKERFHSECEQTCLFTHSRGKNQFDTSFVWLRPKGSSLNCHIGATSPWSHAGRTRPTHRVRSLWLWAAAS